MTEFISFLIDLRAICLVRIYTQIKDHRYVKKRISVFPVVGEVDGRASIDRVVETCELEIRDKKFVFGNYKKCLHRKVIL